MEAGEVGQIPAEALVRKVVRVVAAVVKKLYSSCKR